MNVYSWIIMKHYFSLTFYHFQFPDHSMTFPWLRPFPLTNCWFPDFSQTSRISRKVVKQNTILMISDDDDESFSLRGRQFKTPTAKKSVYGLTRFLLHLTASDIHRQLARQTISLLLSPYNQFSQKSSNYALKFSKESVTKTYFCAFFVQILASSWHQWCMTDGRSLTSRLPQSHLDVLMPPSASC